ncbi:Actin-related protein [Mactra antiquata]
MAEERRVVIDAGTHSCHAGIAGDDAPMVAIPTRIGRPKTEPIMPPFGSRGCYVGDLSQEKRGVLSLEYPIKHGIVEDWNGMEKIYHHIFKNSLRINPSEVPVLLTDPPFNPTANRENMLQIMLETFQCPAFFVCMPAVLSLVASGRHAGVVIDSGEGVTHVVPIEGNYPISPAIKRVNFGGGEITEYLRRLLLQRGYNFSTAAEKEIVREIKDKVSFVAKDFDEEMRFSEMSNKFDLSYTLPDGNTINIGPERFQCAEALFNPELIGFELKGFSELILNSIMSCPIDLRRHYFCNVILSGGNTMIQGITQRVTCDLKRLTYPNVLVKVVEPPERKYSSWIGGSILASLSTFSSMWIDKYTYEEVGPSILRTKCPH